MKSFLCGITLSKGSNLASKNSNFCTITYNNNKPTYSQPRYLIFGFYQVRLQNRRQKGTGKANDLDFLAKYVELYFVKSQKK